MGPDVQYVYTGQLESGCVFAELNRTRVCKNDYNDWPAVRAREGFEKAEARVEELLELGVVHRVIWEQEVVI